MDVRGLLVTLWLALLALPLSIWLGMRVAGRRPLTRILALLASMAAILLGLAIWLSRGH